MTDPADSTAENADQPRAPNGDEVVVQMERILASREFVQSVRLAKLLRFIVEETLADRGDALKEYAIALDVFGRDESFDPQSSSIVRVEASRLRGKLERFYAVEGKMDPVRIDLPPGGYVPAFRTTLPDLEPTSRRPAGAPSLGKRSFAASQIARLLAFAIVAIGIVAILVVYFVPVSSVMDFSFDDAGPAETYSVAVLPLRDLSSDVSDDYFSIGMTDALITRLAKGGLVRVTSMTSVMRYKEANVSLADIAQELGVSHIIEGSVLRIDDRVRITAQLIEASSDRHIWAESYERNFADVLSLQDEVVGRIVASLSGHVASTDNTGSTDPQMINPVAYEAYLRGRYFLNKMTEEGFNSGIEYFGIAIEDAPDFAQAYSGMATCYCLLGGHGFELVEPDEGMQAAKRAITEALRLDATLAEPYAFLGIIRLKYEWDWAGAEEAITRSIAIDPSYVQSHLFYSFYLEAMGRHEAAIREAETARMSDPLSLAANVNLGWQYLQANRLEQARQVFASTAELDPTFWGVHWGMGHYHRRKGEIVEAIAAFQMAIAVGGGHAMPLSALGYTYAIAGQPAEAREMLGKLNVLADEGYVSPFNMAIIHAGLGEADEAFVELEKAFVVRSRSMAWLNVAEELDGLRSDPRFESLVRRVGLSN